jgi:hypothetical protein
MFWSFISSKLSNSGKPPRSAAIIYASLSQVISWGVKTLLKALSRKLGCFPNSSPWAKGLRRILDMRPASDSLAAGIEYRFAELFLLYHTTIFRT